MEYQGAADYYFWQGVLNGLFASPKDLRGEFELGFNSTNATTIACEEAYMWGFCLGCELTEEEYAQLTLHPEPDIIQYNETKSTIKENVVGNC